MLYKESFEIRILLQIYSDPSTSLRRAVTLWSRPPLCSLWSQVCELSVPVSAALRVLHFHCWLFTLNLILSKITRERVQCAAGVLERMPDFKVKCLWWNICPQSHSCLSPCGYLLTMSRNTNFTRRHSTCEFF